MFMFAVPTKVKKTDLPVIPPESEILPSLDDSDDNFSDDLDDEDIEGWRISETETRSNVNN